MSNPYAAGIQNPGAQRKGFTTDKPYKPPSRPDVLASGKWHDEAVAQFPGELFFQRARFDHGALVEAINSLDRLKATKDPRETAARHADRVNSEAEKIAMRLEGKLEKARADGAAKIRATQEITNDFLGISADSRHGMEIRARLSAMSDDERKAAIARAAQEGDREVMAAVLHGPSFLTGVDRDTRDRMADNFRRRHAPHLAKELDQVKRSVEKLELAYKEAPGFVRQNYVDRSHDPAARKAEEARSSFAEATSKL